MIVGIYDKSGAAIVLPLDKAAEATGVSEYQLRQALDGKFVLPGKIVTKLPTNTTWRWPEGTK